MKSRKEINKQNYQRKRDSIKAKYSPAQHKATYSPVQRKLQHDATYSPAQRKRYYNPAQRKLDYIRQKSASAQKVANEQFCNRSTRSTSTSTPNQADIKLPIERRSEGFNVFELKGRGGRAGILYFVLFFRPVHSM